MIASGSHRASDTEMNTAHAFTTRPFFLFKCKILSYNQSLEQSLALYSNR